MTCPECRHEYSGDCLTCAWRVADERKARLVAYQAEVEYLTREAESFAKDAGKRGYGWKDHATSWRHGYAEGLSEGEERGLEEAALEISAYCTDQLSGTWNMTPEEAVQRIRSLKKGKTNA